LGKPESILLFGAEDLAQTFDFSPDGRLIVFDTWEADKDEKIFLRKFDK
jgi:hypothetical protein